LMCSLFMSPPAGVITAPDSAMILSGDPQIALRLLIVCLQTRRLSSRSDVLAQEVDCDR
jgi:hypothetical protein